MLRKSLLLTALIATAPLCWGQTDLVFPWITNNSLFQGTLVINNLNAESVTVTMTATRPAGSNPETITLDPIMINPFQQFAMPVSQLFAAFGPGPGFMVELASDADNITGAFVNVGTGAASGSSPSQANVFNAVDASPVVLFSFLSIGSGFSSPVVINLGVNDAAITFHAYQGGMKVAQTDRTVLSLHPHAELTSGLFPSLSGDLYVVAESDQPLLGVAFIFNDAREPSMANAIAIAEVPNPVVVTPEVSFSVQLQPIFNQFCEGTTCHLNESLNGGDLDLREGLSYDNLVGIPNVAPFFSMLRVEPGNINDSYLYRKLQPPTGENYFGLQMPERRDPLTDQQIELFRDWILQGAPRN